MKHLFVAALLIVGCTHQPTEAELARQAEIDSAIANMQEAQDSLRILDSLQEERINRY